MQEVSFNHFKEYTTTEEPWGYWIDGSVIYRKTMSLSYIRGGEISVPIYGLFPSDFGTLVKIEGSITVANTDDTSPISYAIPFNSGDLYAYVMHDSTQQIPGYLCVKTPSSKKVAPAVVTVYYTKTSS